MNDFRMNDVVDEQRDEMDWRATAIEARRGFGGTG